ncbi:hypothetical protein [Halomonas sp. LBP4]|uniref:hypothetical protein n=1 Tax=Halomonas sp. LBP4 TaxID=2044917 RepID=UPI000D757F0D|nr:hypothetical protein [Halomonas sp. LBP4]PXX99686.1 hypothetical protein CR157_02640 [Halomonas sp. LBP4]
MSKRRQGLNVVAIFLASLTLSGCSEDTEEMSATTEEARTETTAATAQEDYYLKATPEVQSGEWLIVPLTSNIPGDIEVMVSVGLVGQAPDDLAVGTSQRVPLRGGRGEAVLQLSEVPQGDYEVGATFYPRWGFRDGEKIVDIREPIASETQVLAITGSGESAEAYLDREEGQMWVMNNVFPGTPWKPETFRTRFGEWEEFPATKRNPAIIKNYYFSNLEMTIVVNDLKGEVATWMMGREGL